MTKSTAAPPLPVAASTGAAAVASLTRSPIVGAASGRSSASAGSGSASSSSGSRSALNLLQNSAIASLLQPSTPVVTTPPSLPPPSTPPIPSPSTGNVTLTWTANRESDLAGYKVYVGTTSDTYNFPGSVFVTGNVTSYTVSNLPKNQTYFFAISAYDSAGNESPLSAEVSRSIF
ncbi:MAG: fibronectin type III domain-containing protein [Nitrospirota bacterium]